MTEVTVMRVKFVRGWPRHEHGEHVHVLGLGRALERVYSTDAHFTAYRTPNGRRLTREALDLGVPVELTCIPFDVDGPGHAATDEWWAGELPKIEQLNSVHPGVFAYRTRGGYRLIYTQAEPTVLRSQDDAQQWSQAYATCVAYLGRRFEVVADPSCQDWQRCYRLPRATRDRGGRPEHYPTFGNPHRIGALWIEPSFEDIDQAERSSKAFRQRKVLDFTPCGSTGEGLLFHLLRARGNIIREHHDRGVYVVRCPNESEHSIGATGNGSTVLYPPAVGKKLGAIFCRHGHCEQKGPREWLRFFSESEIKDARRAAGITRSAA